MEIVGTVLGTVAYMTSTDQIQKELIAKAGLVEKIKKKYEFAEAKIPTDFSETLAFAGGKFRKDGAEYNIVNFDIGSKGMGTRIIGKTEIAKNFLVDVTQMLDQAGLFEKIADNIDIWVQRSVFKAHLNLDHRRLLNDTFLEFLDREKNSFGKKDFLVDLHPISVQISFVLKPNLEKLNKEYTSSDIAKVLRTIEGRDLRISVDDPEEFYKNIYRIYIEMDTDPAINFIKALEEALHS